MSIEFTEANKATIVAAAKVLQDTCHNAAFFSGWWNHMVTRESLVNQTPDDIPRFNVPEKLCLIHSEVSEAMEGYRKNLQDDKLPHRKMLEVELADAAIRIFDLAGGLKFDLANAIMEKLVFNASRPDHKMEVRMKEGGKTF